MGSKHTLAENPFAVLHATPRDTDARLIDRAVEQKLLFGIDTQEAQNTLLQPGGRLRAEVGYLPCTDEENAEKVLAWLEQAGAGTGNNGDAAPEFETGSRLAVMNSVCAFLQTWPVNSAEEAAAMCLSAARVLSGLSGQQVMEELNEDREAGGRDLLDNPTEVAHRLAEHRRELFALLAKKCDILLDGEHLELLDRLSRAFVSQDGPKQSLHALEEMVNIHLPHREQAVLATTEQGLQEVLEECMTYPQGAARPAWKQKNESNPYVWYEPRIRRMKELLMAWDRFSAPERRIAKAKGYTAARSMQLYEKVNALMVVLWNERHATASCRELMETVYDVFDDLPSNYMHTLQQNCKMMGVHRL